MSVPLWVSELASGFWAEAGAEEPFPRQLLLPARRALPLDVVALPALCVGSVLAWLRQRKIGLALAEPDRPLRGCLVAGKGHGFVFLDSEDAPEEQRFSLAHELAHFLRDYMQPRRLACRHLGEQIREVLDGRRAPTPQERLHALLRNVPLGRHLHLMRRGPRRNLPNENVARAEEEADRLAYELLAPAQAVLVQAGAVQGDSGRDRLAAVLRIAFGLPVDQAEDYSRLLMPPVWQDPLLRRLRL